MAIDWKTTNGRGIAASPYFSQGVAPQSPIMQPGLGQPNYTGMGFGTGVGSSPMMGPYGSPFGLTGLEQPTGGYGFSPYGFTPYGFTPYGPSPYGVPSLGLTPYNTPFANLSLLAGAVGSPITTGFGTGDHVTDQDIENRVEELLGVDPLTCAADIQVQSQDHVVTLTGTVPSKLIKIEAGTEAWIVPGVRDVNNNIQVKSRTLSGKKGQTQRETVGAGNR